MKESIKEYLYFTLSERIGAISLVLLFVAVIYSYNKFANQPPTVDPMLVLQQEMALLKLALKEQEHTKNETSDYNYSKQTSENATSRYSDPRKAKYQKSHKQQTQYSKPKKSTKTYSNKKPERLPQTEYKHKVTPVSLKARGSQKHAPSESNSGITASAPADFSRAKTKVDRKPNYRFRKPLKVDVNKATAESFQKLYGIGPAYSKRIVKFREALGGFSAVHQVSEVYGMPDSTFQSILPNLEISPVILHKMDLNTVSKDDLAMHPYLHWKQAKIIVAYRDMHGPFNHFDDLKKIHGLEQDMIEKMKPYLKVND